MNTLEDNEQIAVSKDFLRDPNLSLKVKGFYYHLKAYDGDFSKISHLADEEEINELLLELFENGYARFDEEKKCYIYSDVKIEPSRHR